MDIQQIVLSILASVTRTENINVKDPIRNLEMDSVQFIQVIICIENALNIEFDDTELTLDHFDTINSLIKYAEELWKKNNCSL